MVRTFAKAFVCTVAGFVLGLITSGLIDSSHERRAFNADMRECVLRSVATYRPAPQSMASATRTTSEMIDHAVAVCEHLVKALPR